MDPDDVGIRATERRLLIRELHDVVTHQLSTIALQVMSQRDGSDPDQLRLALHRIERAASGSLVELRLLDRALREDRVTVDAPEIADVIRLVPPSSAARAWQRRLEAEEFSPSTEVGPAVDRLATTTQRTLSRAIALSADDIGRHAPAGSSCTLSLATYPAKVVLRVESLRRALSSGTHFSGTDGAELRGLRERVDLSGGTFLAGPSPDERNWVVEVALPCDGSAPTADIVVLPGRAGP